MGQEFGWLGKGFGIGIYNTYTELAAMIPGQLAINRIVWGLPDHIVPRNSSLAMGASVGAGAAMFFGGPEVKAEQMVAAEEAGYLYRGVHVGHPGFEAAEAGRVVPGDINGTVSAATHNKDALSVAKSPFTSWTSDLFVAETNAMKAGQGGIILRVPNTPAPRGATWSWQVSPDIYGESEILMRGIRDGVEVMGR